MRAAFVLLIALVAQAGAAPITVYGSGTWLSDFESQPYGPFSSGTLAGSSDDGRSVFVRLGGNWRQGLVWGLVFGEDDASCTIDGISGGGGGPRLRDPRPICVGSFGPGGGVAEIFDYLTNTVLVSEELTGQFSFTTRACGFGVCDGTWIAATPEPSSWALLLVAGGVMWRARILLGERTAKAQPPSC